MPQEYFEAIPGTPSPLPHRSPVSYVSTLVGDGIAERGDGRDFAFEYRISDLAVSNARHLTTLRSKGDPLRLPPKHHTYLRQSGAVASYLLRQYWRNTEYTFSRLLYSLMVALLLGTVYWRMPQETFTGSNSRAAFIFACVVFGSTVNAGSAAGMVSQLKTVFAHQRAVQQYPALLHVVGYTLVEVPYMLFTTLIFVGVSTGMARVALDSPSIFFQFWFTFFLLSLAISYLGLFLALLFPSPQIASVLIPMLTGAWITTGGYILPRSKMEGAYLWMFWTNPLQYALNSLSSLAFFCDTASPQCSPPGCATTPSSCPSCLCPRLRDYGNVFVWTQLKTQRSLDRERVGLDWLFLGCFCLLLRLLTYCALRLLRHNTQVSKG